MNYDRSKTHGVLLILVACIIWGVAAPVRKYLLFNIDPITLVTVSTFFASLILIVLKPMLFFKNIKNIGIEKQKKILLISLFGSVFAPLMYNMALSLIDANVVVILEKIKPIFVIVLALIFLNEKYEGKFYIYSIFLIFLSIMFVNYNIEVNIKSESILGYILVIGASLSFAIAAILSKYMLIVLPPAELLTLRMFYSSIFLNLILISKDGVNTYSTLTLNQFIYLFILAFITLYIAFLLFYQGLKIVKAGVTGVLEMITPILAVLISIWILDESLTVIQIIIAFFMILLSYKIGQLEVKKN